MNIKTFTRLAYTGLAGMVVAHVVSVTYFTKKLREFQQTDAHLQQSLQAWEDYKAKTPLARP